MLKNVSIAYMRASRAFAIASGEMAISAAASRATRGPIAARAHAHVTTTTPKPKAADGARNAAAPSPATIIHAFRR